MTALLDVNALIALVDSDHVHHLRMRKWFLRRTGERWATCASTENGMVRVLAQPAYRSGQRTPAEAIDVLSALKAAFQGSHEFWATEISICDAARFEPELIAGTRQITNVYLLGLAAEREGVLVSFDRTVAWQGNKLLDSHTIT